MTELSPSQYPRRIARVLFALLTVALLAVAAGCGGKQESGGESAAPAAQNASAPPSPNRVLVHQSNECLEFTPARDSLQLGDSLTWVAAPELKSTVTIQLPSGAFADSTWQLAPGGSVPSGPSLRQGVFNYTRPVSCGKPTTTGPGVDIGGSAK